MLQCKKYGKYTKWYIKVGKQLTYLKKNQRVTAEELATKKYYTFLMEDLIHEKEAIELYLDYHKTENSKALQLLDEKSAYYYLLDSKFKSFSSKILEWVNSLYDQSIKNPEKLIHKSISGNIVRSKSEVMIDMSLYINKIPFRYECALYLGNITYYPDFTILHPKTGKIYYWEHFGMMDDIDYSKKTYKKLKVYNDNGYIQSINLITTFETKENPLTADCVERIIKQYFL